ncbi:spore germination protein GerPC [Paenibacillus harenae]|uniref:Spore germination protein PC n=1 Tax=Paenibacillus harenae TaxID=306543 RepID=A0ABT9TXN6_PAEHA|nr:spore germination protein GerPC [Paenibacillus harenae]MDQ0058326.1 spore germination protein PC [Paenibacillus harenae]MDQ0111671.1 spore germination protein PC [Paenibacillus harenae]
MQQQGPLSPWQAWAHDVMHKLTAQQAIIERMEKQIADLCEQVKQLESRPAYHIDSIEYHFDQLKVEKLDGTLNIGMTAPGSGGDQFPGSIDQLSVPAPEVFPSAAPAVAPHSPLYNEIHTNMNRYLDTDAAERLIAIESDLCIPLDPYHRRIILNDIKKQMPTRIHYYMQQTSSGGNEVETPRTNENQGEVVLAKAIRDADAAMLAYMKQLQSGQPPSGGTV